ncbi:MAG TPA: alpha-E domain-containing protein [Tepidisphaeraceae bacterium]|jgi:uncharacterized alpha-E superfamily protein|nr:alpha-E domain-containing protein [Tepidisphaeraceae bacterium]
MSPPPTQAETFNIERSPRPILAREAESTYWMSRYVERVENIARMLLVSVETLVEMRDLAPSILDHQWESVLRVMHVDAPAPIAGQSIARRISYHMTFEESNPNSLMSCLTRARENARGIREGISSEMWEHLNTLYWAIRADEATARFHDTPAQFFQQVVTGAMNFQGLTDQTLPHDQRWHFARLGRHFERVAFTCRTMLEKFDILSALQDAAATGPDSPFRNIQGVGLLRCCNSQEAYRRAYPGELHPRMIAGFLMLDSKFPRSVRHCVRSASDAASAIRSEARPKSVDAAERTLGKLQARLDYADPTDILEGIGLTTELGYIQQQVARAALAVQKSYFLH